MSDGVFIQFVCQNILISYGNSDQGLPEILSV